LLPKFIIYTAVFLAAKEEILDYFIFALVEIYSIGFIEVSLFKFNGDLTKIGNVAASYLISVCFFGAY